MHLHRRQEPASLPMAHLPAPLPMAHLPAHACSSHSFLAWSSLLAKRLQGVTNDLMLQAPVVKTDQAGPPIEDLKLGQLIVKTRKGRLFRGTYQRMPAAIKASISALQCTWCALMLACVCCHFCAGAGALHCTRKQAGFSICPPTIFQYELCTIGKLFLR